MGTDSRLKPEAAEGPAENQLTDKIIGAAIEVHRHLGPGLLESAYEECLCYELGQLSLRFERQVHLPIHYKGIELELAYRMDLVVEDAIVVEIKATEDTPAIYSAQVLTYLKAAGLRVGLPINFNVPVLTRDLKRIVNHYTGPMPSSLDAETQRRREECQSRGSIDSPLDLPPRRGARCPCGPVSASKIPASKVPASRTPAVT
jgi:GxxExxY protein